MKAPNKFHLYLNSLLLSIVNTDILFSNMPDEEHDKELKTTTEDDLLRLSQEELILNVRYNC